MYITCPRNVYYFYRWYKLKDKPGKEKNKDRGELEVKIAFIVKAGSLADLSKKEKHKSSLGQLSQALGKCYYVQELIINRTIIYVSKLICNCIYS